MKFITVSQRYFDMCKDDPEFLFRENRRPHLLVVSLRYKNTYHRFAVPLRSNISARTPKKQYFPLPPRPVTRPGNHHGLHYIKMFPIIKEYQEKYWMGKDSSYLLFQDIINRHEKEIIAACQEYLDNYAAGIHPLYAVDIDKAFKRLESNSSQKSD